MDQLDNLLNVWKFDRFKNKITSIEQFKAEITETAIEIRFFPDFS